MRVHKNRSANLAVTPYTGEQPCALRQYFTPVWLRFRSENLGCTPRSDRESFGRCACGRSSSCARNSASSWGGARSPCVPGCSSPGGRSQFRRFLQIFPRGQTCISILGRAFMPRQSFVWRLTTGYVLTRAKLDFARNAQGKPAKEPCEPPLVAATELNGSSLTPAQQDLYDRVVDAFSMRNFVPTPGYSGHDQFFSTFDRFGGLDKSHTGQWIDEITRRADAENNQYLELMETPSFSARGADCTRSWLQSRSQPRCGRRCSIMVCGRRLLKTASR